MNNDAIVAITNNQLVILKKINLLFWILLIANMLWFTVINYKIDSIREEIKTIESVVEKRIVNRVDSLIVNDINLLGLK